jgi:hypothetical protein
MPAQCGTFSAAASRTISPIAARSSARGSRPPALRDASPMISPLELTATALRLVPPISSPMMVVLSGENP